MLAGSAGCGDDEREVHSSRFTGAIIGDRPQDKKLRYDAERLRRDGWVDDDGQWLGKLRIGAENELRENVTLHTGTANGGGVTRVGDHNLLMVGCHVAHDCVVGDHCATSPTANSPCRPAADARPGPMASTRSGSTRTPARERGSCS